LSTTDQQSEHWQGTQKESVTDCLRVSLENDSDSADSFGFCLALELAVDLTWMEMALQTFNNQCIAFSQSQNSSNSFTRHCVTLHKSMSSKIKNIKSRVEVISESYPAAKNSFAGIIQTCGSLCAQQQINLELVCISKCLTEIQAEHIVSLTQKLAHFTQNSSTEVHEPPSISSELDDMMQGHLVVAETLTSESPSLPKTIQSELQQDTLECQGCLSDRPSLPNTVDLTFAASESQSHKKQISSQCPTETDGRKSSNGEK
jgi:hypothetical protein